ncbi:thioredoxin family protein [Paenibacillus sp. P96]|uniref:Thioredoxin n=1 Tax=Paenibacillus zeirhizosphaerae TaxID=2987519 RepID=A0ABT9FQJ6_9BACL|nr:thioredoxin family protein [Paenibacillus sp. P96]MDP4097008.1 thioredoxin family protein [Paenibacillus sp. P96]
MSMQTIDESQYLEWVGGADAAVLEFGAGWCPPCKVLMPILHGLADEYGAAVKFATVDADESPELASQFGVMSLPTVIFFKDGQPVDKLVGLRPADVYRNVINRQLAPSRAEL